MQCCDCLWLHIVPMSCSYCPQLLPLAHLTAITSISTGVPATSIADACCHCPWLLMLMHCYKCSWLNFTAYTSTAMGCRMSIADAVLRLPRAVYTAVHCCPCIHLFYLRLPTLRRIACVEHRRCSAANAYGCLHCRCITGVFVVDRTAFTSILTGCP